MILDDQPGEFQPIVRVIDSFERNHRLGVIVECRAGAGKLLICSCDLFGQQGLPEARQLLASLLAYVKSDAFEPSVRVSNTLLREMFMDTPNAEALCVVRRRHLRPRIGDERGKTGAHSTS
jgi:hypothetical protein